MELASPGRMKTRLLQQETTGQQPGADQISCRFEAVSALVRECPCVCHPESTTWPLAARSLENEPLAPWSVPTEACDKRDSTQCHSDRSPSVEGRSGGIRGASLRAGCHRPADALDPSTSSFG